MNDNKIFKASKFLGKVAYYGKRRIHAVTLDCELKEVSPEKLNWETLQPIGEGNLELSICGNIWNHIRTDIYCGGQCLDTIGEFIKRPTFKRIREIWDTYHLNDMKSGTKKQSEAVAQWRKENNITGYDYTEACEYLKSIELYEDRGYKYGHGWLYRPIPSDVIREVLIYFGGEVTEQMRLFLAKSEILPAPVVEQEQTCECWDTRGHSC